MARVKRKENISDKTNSNRSKSKWLVGILILVILVLGGIFIIANIYVNNGKEALDDTTNDINDKFFGNKAIGDVTLSNIKCSFDGNVSLLEYTITNNGNKSVILGDYEIIVKDADKNVIAILVSGADYELKPGEEFDTGNVIDLDLSKVNSIELGIE